MRDVTIRRRTDGTVQIIRLSAPPLDRLERYLLAVTVLFTAQGYFVAGHLPPQVNAIVSSIVLACLAGAEIGEALRSRALLRRPKATVEELPRRR
jgi:hypothetical protein